jgi:drug/metabolite transporter (DMT)-like permease
MNIKSQNSQKAYILLLITAFAWGGNAVAGKLAVGHISPLLLTLLRWVVALSVITLISFPQLVKDFRATIKHLPFLILMGFMGFTTFNALFYTALHYTSAINCVIEQAGMPMLIFLGNFFFFRMRASWGQVAGFVLTLFGVALTASNGDLSTLLSLNLNFGDALMLLAVVVYAGYTIALRYKPDLHWKTTMAAMSVGALIAAAPLAGFEIWNGSAMYPDLFGWGVVIYIGLFPSLVAQICFIMGVEAIGANRAGLFINMVPIFGTMLSVLIIGETLHLYHVIALVLVLGGIVIAERSRPAQAAT